MVTIKLKKLIRGRKYPKPFSFLNTQDGYVDKVYEIPFFRGIALRESDMVGKLFEKASKNEIFSREEIEECLRWFCLIFDNKFTQEELLEGYPADQLMKDIFSAYYAMQSHVMVVLAEFPIPPTVTEGKTEA